MLSTFGDLEVPFVRKRPRGLLSSGFSRDHYGISLKEARIARQFKMLAIHQTRHAITSDDDDGEEIDLALDMWKMYCVMVFRKDVYRQHPLKKYMTINGVSPLTLVVYLM